MVDAIRLGLCAAVVAGVGCGASPPRENQLHDGFAAMQVHEATLVASAHRAADPALPCASRSEAAEHACEAAEAACVVARPLLDADADARCVDATDACVAVRAGVGFACDSLPSGGSLEPSHAPRGDA